MLYLLGHFCSGPYPHLRLLSASASATVISILKTQLSLQTLAGVHSQVESSLDSGLSLGLNCGFLVSSHLGV